MLRLSAGSGITAGSGINGFLSDMLRSSTAMNLGGFLPILIWLRPDTCFVQVP